MTHSWFNPQLCAFGNPSAGIDARGGESVTFELHAWLLISGGALDVVDDNYFDGALAGFEFQA